MYEIEVRKWSREAEKSPPMMERVCALCKHLRV